jgi:hypothetical protein
MSAASRQQTCAVCATSLTEVATDIEPLIDDVVRYVAVCKGCSTFPHHSSLDVSQQSRVTFR